MPGARNYTITIYDRTTAGKETNKPIAGDDNKSKDTSNTATSIASAPQGGDSASAAEGVMAMAWMTIKQVGVFAKRAAAFEISQVSLRTGRQEEQQRLQSAVDVASQIISFGVNVAAGAAVGGVVGAVAAATLSIANTAFTMYQQVAQFNTQRTLDSISLGIMSQRSGNSLAYVNGGR